MIHRLSSELSESELRATKNRVLREMCEAEYLVFVKCIFKYVYRRKLVLKPFHYRIAEKLESVARGETKRLIINIAPRFGKTEFAAVLFIAWLISKNPRAANMYVSYSDNLAMITSDNVRALILSDWFKELWPDVQLSDTQASKQKWNTKQGGGLYAASTGGQITGFGAGSFEQFNKEVQTIDGLILIDDPQKPEDAKSSLVQERVKSVYKGTIRTRRNSRDTPIVVFMQRLDADDLTGYLLSDADADEWETLIVKAVENGVAAFPEKISLEDAQAQEREDPDLFHTQFQQDPPDKSGYLYKAFKEYAELPNTPLYGMYNQTDTADKGTDFLFSVNYKIDRDGLIYIIDMLYSDEGGDVTEPALAKLLKEGKVIDAVFEANNGGEGFARAVKKLYKNGVIRTKHQSKNKEAKIISNAARVQERIIMPANWMHRWPRVYKDLSRFKKIFKANAHDDAPDVLTEIVLRHPVGKQRARGTTNRINKKVI